MNTFFSNSDYLDRLVLRPLSHIKSNWELTWDEDLNKYIEEDDSFAVNLNLLICELDRTTPPAIYHDNEDRLAEYVKTFLNWSVVKVGARWVGADYDSLLEQGGFHDVDETNLVLAASGRIQAAKVRGQLHFDDMEKSHRRMLAAVLSVILYHRYN